MDHGCTYWTWFYIIINVKGWKRKTYLTLEHLLTFVDSYESTKVGKSAKVYLSANVV